MNQQALSTFLWSVADLLRGDSKQSDYGKVILPLTVLRRIDCVLVPTKTAVNPESYAICKADMMIKGQDVGNIVFGNTLSDDGHAENLDYMLSNPPFGVEWKKESSPVFTA